MPPDRPIRSDTYQWKLLELPFSNDMFDWSYFQRSMFGVIKASPEELDELRRLDDQLKAAIQTIIDQHFTPLQREAWQLTVDGYTQVEIGKILNVNQTTIHKTIMGNLTYQKDGTTVMYGGAAAKLKKLIPSDSTCLELVRQIHAYLDADSGLYLPFYSAARAAFGSHAEFETLMASYEE